MCTPPSLCMQEVWQAFHKCPLLAAHKDFVHGALWERLVLGDKQKDWKLGKVSGPFDEQRETISQLLFHCTLLQTPFNRIDSGPATVTGTSLCVKDLIQNRPTEPLSTPPGLLGQNIHTHLVSKCSFVKHLNDP